MYMQVAEKVLQLSSCLLDDNLTDPVICRAAAEISAAACCIGSDALTIKQIRVLCAQLATALQDSNGVDVRYNSKKGSGQIVVM